MLASLNELTYFHEKAVLTPGEAYLVKIGQVHRFFNPGAGVIKFRNQVYPGHEGVENTLRIMAGLATDGLYNERSIPRDFTHLAICGIMSDMRLPGLMALTTPLLKLVAAIGRRRGIQQQLVEKYCQ
jgi:hypothetical protein